MDIITFTDARANLKAVMDKVAEDRTPVIIHRRDAEDMVLISKAEWESLQETLHLLSSPRNAERLLASIARFRAMEAELDAELRDEAPLAPGFSMVREDPAPFEE